MIKAIPYVIFKVIENLKKKLVRISVLYLYFYFKTVQLKY